MKEVTISLRCLSSVAIGQFARLLPSLDVVAVSQAPSPESNPNSPLPVTATVVTTLPSKLIGQILLRACTRSSLCASARVDLYHPYTTAIASVGFRFVNCIPLNPKEWLPPGLEEWDFSDRY